MDPERHQDVDHQRQFFLNLATSKNLEKVIHLFFDLRVQMPI